MQSKQLVNKIIIYTIIGGLFAILVTPFVVANPNFFPYITGKAYTFRILAEIITALWIILMVRDSSYRPSKKPITIAVVALAVFALVSDLLGVEVMRSIWSNYERMEGWIMIVHLLLYFFVATSVLKTKKLWNYWFGFTLTVSLIIAVWGLFQIGCASTSPNPQYLVDNTKFCIGLAKSGFARFFGGLQIMQGDRLNSTLGNAGYYGVYTLIHIFIAGILFIRSRSEKWKMWTTYTILIAGICNVLALYYTGTRGSMLGLIAGVLVSGAAYLWLTWRAVSTHIGHNKVKLPKSWYVVLTSLIIVILIVPSIWLARNSSFIQNTRFLSRYANISISDTKSQARNYIWPMALKGFVDKPIFGWGQENFNYVFNKYYDPRMWAQEQWFDRAHNVFLDWLVSGGILGFISYLALYLIPMWYIFRRSKLPIADKSLFLGLLIAYGIHNVFIFDNISSYIMFFGILAYINRDWVNQGSEGGNRSSISTDEDVVNYVITPIVLVLLIVSLYFVNIRSINANTTLSRSIGSCSRQGVSAFDDVLTINDPTGKEQIREQLWTCTITLLQSPDVPIEAKNDAYSVSMAEINNQLNVTKNDARIYFFAGSILSLAGNHEESILAFAKAHELSPNKPSFIMGQAGELFAVKKNSEAAALFKKAYDLSPEFPVAKTNYAISLLQDNKVSEAVQIVGDDNYAKMNSLYVTTLYEKKALKELIPIMQYRIKVDPNNVKNYISLAAIYIDPSINEKALAKKTILQIKEVDPKNTTMVDTLIQKYNL